jgi:RNA polymerase sigma-70 factor (ECF subfamily)
LSNVLKRYHHELVLFLTRQTRDREDAADLAQESIGRVLALQSAGHAVVDLRALLFRTARNLLVDRHRRAQVRRHEDLHALAEAELPTAPVHQQPEEALSSQQTVRAYLAAIEALPPRCREVFVLHVFDELTHAQIAQRLGISVSMVEKHVVRGMISCRDCARRLRGDPEPDPAPKHA